MDFNIIKLKVEKENSLKLNSLKLEYQLNNCETKGHLQALKSICTKLNSEIELQKKVNLYKI